MSTVRRKTLRRFALAAVPLIALMADDGREAVAKSGKAEKALDRKSTRLRRQLQIVERPLPRIPAYSSFGACSYKASYAYFNGQKSELTYSLRMAPVRSAPNRVLITTSDGASTSTAIIGNDGRLFDFNLMSTDGRRWTGENYASQARQVSQNAGKPGQIVNHLTVAFPQYAQRQWRPGEEIATILAEDGRIWGRMVYRGISGAGEWPAAVVDILRASDGALAGFSVVEVVSLVPLLVVLRTGYASWRFERISCP